MIQDDLTLTVIVPAYNEAKRIGSSLQTIAAFLKKQSYKSEILIVDDGSVDETIRVTNETLADFPHTVVKMPVNRGKGNAVREGMLRGQGKYLLFTDADLSTPIEEINRFIPLFEQGYEVIIGSRALPESNIIIHQNFLRELMGKTFNRLARLFAFKGIRDSQCGFKCFKRETARELFAKQRLEGFSFDVEILFLAQRKGCRILEVPVSWRNSAQSRVRLVKDSLGMFWDVLKIRWIHRNS